MRGVDHRIDLLVAQGNGRAPRRRRKPPTRVAIGCGLDAVVRPASRQRRLEARIAGEKAGQCRGFRGAAEDENAHCRSVDDKRAGNLHGHALLSIVGIGEDGADGLSPVAQKLIAAAELVVGGKRHLALADGLIRGRTLAWPSPIGEAMPEIEKHRGRPVVVLASGDPFHYGIGDLLLRSIPAAETLCLPQSSAFSLTASRLGWSLQDVALCQPAWPRARGHRAPPASRARASSLCRGTARRPPSWRSF